MTGTMLLTRPGPRPPEAAPGQPAAGRPSTRVRWPEIAVAAAGFAALCALVLTKATSMLEPDDYAYQASIVALSQGHVLLTTAQYHQLSRSLGDGGTSIPQWVHLPDGRWMSQKNPGYPFLAVVFYVIGALRLAPLFYGALASGALFVGARRWLGAWGGTIAVLLFCTSGAAITFAWRPTMETFTDASLVAAGAGLLLWTMLATDAPQRRRLVAGLGAFLALEAATFTRYTDVLELVVAAAVALLLARRCGLRWRTVGAWMATVAASGVGVLAFNAVVYGAPLRTGYASGLISFSFTAIGPNLVHMPWKLVAAMPVAVVAGAAVLWIVGRALAPELDLPVDRADVPARRRDVAVALALVGGWIAMWGLYLAYTWTVGQAGADPVHVVRFYVPALGPVALLAAWALVRLPVVVWAAAVLALLGAGVASFHVMSAAGGPGGGPLGHLPGSGGLPGGPGGPGGSA
ncbi:MAG: hypothetical protein ACRDZR_01005, partial [Acidimicrobiales bacterium]